LDQVNRQFRTNFVLTVSFVIGTVALCCADTGSWPICGKAKRITCIVDGDTFWKDDVKYRLLGVVTPEAGDKAQCGVERDATDQATKRLQQVFESGALSLLTQGTDTYGRTLVIVTANGANAADALIAERFGRGGFYSEVRLSNDNNELS
jgi:micrococcal nuclease